MIIPDEIQQARMKLLLRCPYLAMAIYSLIPVESWDVETMAVDKYWRLYYNPTAISSINTDDLAGVLYHEIQHLLRLHHHRMKDRDAYLSNLATDAEINDDLIVECIPLPGAPITPKKLGMPDHLTAEEYYDALVKNAGSPGLSGGGSSIDIETGGSAGHDPDDPSGSNQSDLPKTVVNPWDNPRSQRCRP